MEYFTESPHNQCWILPIPWAPLKTPEPIGETRSLTFNEIMHIKTPRAA